MTPKRLSILGVGLLGGSVGLAVKRHVTGCHITGCGRDAAGLGEAVRLGAIDQFMTDACQAVAEADWVVLAVPVGTAAGLLRQIGKTLRPGVIVTDVGSTKRSIVEAAAELLPEGVHFVGSHPMAGSERTGVAHASADLLTGALCIVTPDAKTRADAVDAVDEFWRRLGMRTTRMSPADHDTLVARASHLPHAVAAALVASQDGASMSVAGKGLADATRIAAGDPVLWRDIFLDNRDAVMAALAGFREHLDAFEAAMEKGDAEALQSALAKAAEKRKSIR